MKGAGLVAIAVAGLSASACANYAPPTPPVANSYANFLVGRLADLSQDHDAASEHYYEALQRSPADPDLVEGALNSALAAGDVERAHKVADIASAHRVASAHASMVRAVDALAAGHWREAREQALHVRGGASTDLIQRILLVWARTGEGHAQEAIAQIGDVADARPFTGLFAYQRAMAFDYAGRNTEALAAYQEAEQGGLWLPSGIERHAGLLVRTGAKDQALEILQRAGGREDNPLLSADAARLTADGALELTPLTPARGAAIGLYGVSAVLLQDADSTDGLAALTLALMLDPGLDGARISYAQAQVELGHSAKARDALSHVSPQSPLAESAKTMEAWVLLGEGRSEDAVEAAQSNVDAGGGPRARRALADIERSVGRYADAEPIYTALIGEGSDDWRLYFARGAARERMNRWPEGEADLRHALEISPDQPEVLNYLGYTWVDRGEHLQEGLAMLQHAAEIRPQSGAIIDSLGWGYFKSGQYDEAISYLERAVELTPSDSIVNNHLGDAYWRAGKHIEARFQWQRALSLDPDDADRPGLEQKLANGLPALPPSRSAHR